jgi:putative DNA primase/helicase
VNPDFIEPPADVQRIALSLAAQGWHVFPVKLAVQPDGRTTKKPLVLWHDEATTDPQTIATWWGLDFPGAWIGVHAARSGIVIVDMDRHGEKDGYASLAAAGKKLPKTFHYPTRSGGEHHVYSAPPGVDLTIGTDVEIAGEKRPGVDVRAGTGLVVYYGPRMKKAPKLAPAPKWSLLERGADRGTGAGASLEEWRASLVRPTKKYGPATAEVLALVTEEGMSREQMLDVTQRLVGQGTAGHPGILRALGEGRATYTRNYPASAPEWDKAVEGSARHRGPYQALATLPLSAAREVRSTPDPGTAIEPRPSAPRDLVPAPEPEDEEELAPHLTMDTYFQKGEGLLSRRLALQVVAMGENGGDLAVGADRRVWRYADGVFTPASDVVTSRVVRILDERYRPAHAATVLDVITKGDLVPMLQDAPNPELVNVRNGMLNWQTGTLHDHGQGYHSTVQLAVDYLPEETCPAFDAWLAAAVEPDTAVVVWELIAYAMMTGNPFQKAALLTGDGGTGKGTLIRVIEALAGEQNVAHLTPADMATTFLPATLVGKLLNTVGDLDGKYLPDTAPFKKVVGGDGITAQHKGKEPFTFTPIAFPIFAANEIATSSDATNGYFRRWLVIPFDRKITFRDAGVERALHAELPGIFAKAMRVLPGLMAQGDFSPTISTARAMRAFALGSDTVRLWLEDDDHVREADPSATQFRTRRAHLYDTYAAWTEATGHGRPMSRTKFLTRLRLIGYEVDTVAKGERYVRGIDLDTVPMSAPVTVLLDDTTSEG